MTRSNTTNVKQEQRQRRAQLLSLALFSLLTGLVVGAQVYHSGTEYQVNTREIEARRLTQLSSAFTKTYSELIVDQGFAAPVPASFRARAHESFNESGGSAAGLKQSMVGIPGREIVTAPQSGELRDRLLEMFYTSDKIGQTYTFEENGSTWIRSVFPTVASSQGCVDCHNNIQQLELPWKLNDLMGASVVDQSFDKSMATIYWLSVWIGGLSGAAMFLAIALIFKNLRLARQSQELKRLVHTDALTGCLNRRALFDTADQRFVEAGGKGGVLVLDLDHFKSINDRHGHQMGDKVLETFADLLRENSRVGDLVARVGGEEFVLCLPGMDKTQVLAIAERIRRHVESTRIPLEDAVPGSRESALTVTVSIGGIMVDTNIGSSIEEWMYRADKHLYQAKHGGRNRIVIAA